MSGGATGFEALKIYLQSMIDQRESPEKPSQQFTVIGDT